MAPVILRKIIFGLLIVSSSVLFSQNTQEEQWLHYYNEYQFNERWGLYSDASYRWKESMGERAQYLFRSGLGYTINPRFRTLAGIAISRKYLTLENETRETRPYQELDITLPFRKWKLHQRLRMEERFTSHLNTDSFLTDQTFDVRMRFSLMGTIPIFHLSKKQPEASFLLQLGDEIMFNAASSNGKKLFDQNRVLISPTIRFNPELAISITWMSCYSDTLYSIGDKDTNVIWVQIRHRLGKNLRKS